MLPCEEEEDGALTVHHDHTFASLRVGDDRRGPGHGVAHADPGVGPAAGQRDSQQGRPTSRSDTLLGTVSLAGAGDRSAPSQMSQLRYNFPAAGLTDEALQTLDRDGAQRTGADVRRQLVGD